MDIDSLSGHRTIRFITVTELGVKWATQRGHSAKVEIADGGSGVTREERERERTCKK